jgi:hypothetical protein
MEAVALAIVAFALYVMGVTTGFFGLLFFLGRRRERRIKRQVGVPLGPVVGDGLDDATVESINEKQLAGMDREEALMLIAATEAFVAELKTRFVYEPTESEQAVADIIEEGDQEWAEAMALSTPMNEA